MIKFCCIFRSTQLIPLYPIYPVLPHLSWYTALIPLYPTHLTLPHLSHSTSPIPLYPLIPLFLTYPTLTHLSHFTQHKMLLFHTYPTQTQPSYFTPPIPIYPSHHTLLYPFHSTQSNIKREQKLQTRTKITNASKKKNTLINYIDSIY